MLRHPLYFIRHGQTDWNAEARFQGQKDIPLNDTGRGQAKRNGETLKPLVDPADFQFIASPLGRTRETMEIARTAMGLPPTDYQTDDLLKELSFGAWEGRTVEDLEKNEIALWAERKTDKWNFAPPGGESYADLTERVRHFFLALDKPTIVVSHGGVNRALQFILGHMTAAELAKKMIPQDQFMFVDGDALTWI